MRIRGLQQSDTVYSVLLFLFSAAIGGLGWSGNPALHKVIVDWSKPLLDGGLGPGSSSQNLVRSIQLLVQAYGFDLATPFEKFPDKIQNLLLYGEPQRGGKTGFLGVLGHLRQNLDASTSETYREYLLDFMSATECSVCHGKRLRPESLAVKVNGMSIADFTSLPIARALEAARDIRLTGRELTIAGRIAHEITERLEFLHNVGLGYLQLGRSAATLSGGEGQRIRLATQIGSKLRGVLYVLDEPSIGLHHRDNGRLLAALENLRDLGNTVLVVEHDEETIRRADYVIDLGPGAGRHGGELVAAGTPAEIMNSPASLTGAYIAGRQRIAMLSERRSPNGKAIAILGARENNLKNLDVAFPLGVMTVVTGVSGSGKSTLVNDILYRALAKQLYRSREEAGAHKSITGAELIDKVIRIDQSPIGRTPRSNPATYTGIFAAIRDLYAMLPESRERGYKPGRFSFNVAGGRCEACQGEGQRRIEMNFLPDVYVQCEVCGGRRYNHETLSVCYKGYSIADLLETPVSDVLQILENIPQVKQKLQTLVDVGLGYIHLGQSAVTLSGGEAQRIKLARELGKRQTGKTLYLLDVKAANKSRISASIKPASSSVPATSALSNCRKRRFNRCTATFSAFAFMPQSAASATWPPRAASPVSHGLTCSKNSARPSATHSLRNASSARATTVNAHCRSKAASGASTLASGTERASPASVSLSDMLSAPPPRLSRRAASRRCERKCFTAPSR